MRDLTGWEAEAVWTVGGALAKVGRMGERVPGKGLMGRTGGSGTDVEVAGSSHAFQEYAPGSVPSCHSDSRCRADMVAKAAGLGRRFESGLMS